MKRCWCQAVMAAWLGAGAPTASLAALRRWECACEQAGGDCAARLEAIALRIPHLAAAREGLMLSVFTSAGKLRFIDNPRDEVAHRYLGPIEPYGQLVWRRQGLREEFLLFGQRDAEPTLHADLLSALAASVLQRTVASC